VQLREPRHEREPDPHAWAVGDDLVALSERLEDGAAELYRNAGTRVLNDEQDALAVAGRLDPYRGSVRRVADGVTWFSCAPTGKNDAAGTGWVVTSSIDASR
jgi:hypothetical protein